MLGAWMKPTKLLIRGVSVEVAAMKDVLESMFG